MTRMLRRGVQEEFALLRELLRGGLPCTSEWQPTVALALSDWLSSSSIEEKATTMVEAVAATSALVASSPSSVSTPGVEA
jgi:hypothetical protein